MKGLLTVLLTAVTVSSVVGLELNVMDASVIRVGVVDMDEVMASLPRTQRAERDYVQLKETRRKEIALMEDELDELIKKRISLQTEIEQLETQLKQLKTTRRVTVSTDAVEVSSPTPQIQQIESSIQSKQKNLEELNKAIEDQRHKIQKKKRDVEEELRKFKEKEEALILAELYEVIKEIAEKENLNVVIDKSGILYGVPEVDITEKVLKFLKKR